MRQKKIRIGLLQVDSIADVHNTNLLVHSYHTKEQPVTVG